MYVYTLMDGINIIATNVLRVGCFIAKYKAEKLAYGYVYLYFYICIYVCTYVCMYIYMYVCNVFLSSNVSYMFPLVSLFICRSA